MSAIYHHADMNVNTVPFILMIENQLNFNARKRNGERRLSKKNFAGISE